MMFKLSFSILYLLCNCQYTAGQLAHNERCIFFIKDIALVGRNKQYPQQKDTHQPDVRLHIGNNGF